MTRMWEVLSTGVFDEWYAGLGEDAKVEVIAKVELLKVFGPQLARPHADTLNGSKYKNMKELRADTRDAAMRIAFAFDPERSAILLLGGDKAGVSQKRFYKRLIATADALFERHVQRIESRKTGDRLWRNHLTNW